MAEKFIIIIDSDDDDDNEIDNEIDSSSRDAVNVKTEVKREALDSTSTFLVGSF